MFGILLLLVAWMGWWLVFCEAAERGLIDSDWRLRFLLACIGWGASLVGVVEITSTLHAFTRLGIAVAWMLGDAAIFGTWFRLNVRRNGRLIFPQNWFGFTYRREEWPVDARCFLGLTILMAALLFVIAVITPSSNYDSMTYHLARVMHWIQQGSVDHFPTSNGRQIEFGPFSSFVMANLYLMWQGDRLVNLVQWLSFCGVVIATQLIASRLFLRALNLTRLADDLQLVRMRNRIITFTGLLIATLPMTIVEAVTTQNDYVVTFWLCSLVSCGFYLLNRPGLLICCFSGLAAGLGALTKPVIYIYAAPFIIFGAIQLYRKVDTGRQRLILATAFTLCFVVINEGHMLRNYNVYHSPLGSRMIASLETNERMSPGFLMSNVLRNISLHINSGVPVVTQTLDTVIGALHKLTGVDENDPATTYYVGKFLLPEHFTLNDSYASATWHLLLIAVSVVAAAFLPRTRRLYGYFLLVLASALLFCTLLKWQIWHSRLHLAYFVLLMPFSANVVVVAFHWIGAIVGSSLTLAAGCFSLAMNDSRPVFNASYLKKSREERYLALSAASLTPDIKKVCDVIAASKCENVGLKFRFDDVEYPFWIMLKNRGFHGKIFHFYVENESAKIVSSDIPCVIISTEETVPLQIKKYFPTEQKIGQYTLLWANNGAPSVSGDK